MEQLSQQWQIHWDSHAVQPRAWQSWEALGPPTLLTTDLIFLHIPAASLSHGMRVLHRAQNPSPLTQNWELLWWYKSLPWNQIKS